MACLNTLKLEIKTLEQIFSKNHERFQVLTATVDELTCRFIGHNNRRYDIHANITVGDQTAELAKIVQFAQRNKCIVLLSLSVSLFSIVYFVVAWPFSCLLIIV